MTHSDGLSAKRAFTPHQFAPLDGRPARVAVVGDSRATACRLPAGSLGFAEILPELHPGRLEVRNFAREGLMVDRYLPEVSSVLEWRPDVVICVFGGRESIYRLPRPLRKLRCNPNNPLPRGWLAPVAWARHGIWRAVGNLMTKHPRAGHRLMRLVGAHAVRSPERYRLALGELLRQLRSIGAKTILVEHFDCFHVEYPWDPAVREANSLIAREYAAELAGEVISWDPKAHYDFAGHFLNDGVHLTVDGHRIMAAAFLPTVAALLPADAPPAGSERVPL